MAIRAVDIGVRLDTVYGRWHCNVCEGDYTIWPGRGVEVRHKDSADDPSPISELVLNGAIGPPVGLGTDGKPEMKIAKWRTSKIKGVYVDKDTSQSASVN